MSSSKNCSGSVPKTISAGRQSRSSLIIFLIKSSIRGRLSVHLVEFCLIANDFLSCVWNLFTNPLARLLNS